MGVWLDWPISNARPLTGHQGEGRALTRRPWAVFMRLLTGRWRIRVAREIPSLL